MSNFEEEGLQWNFMFVGDISVQLQVLENDKRLQLVKNFLQDHNMRCYDSLVQSVSKYTYRHPTLDHCSFIYNIFVSSHMINDICKVDIIDCALNCSDHLPIYIVV